MARSKNIFTDDLCQKPVKKRTNITDPRTPGLYVSISPSGHASFIHKFWDSVERKQKVVKIGTYVRGTFGVSDARAAVNAQQDRRRTTGALPTASNTAPGTGIKFPALVEAYVAHCKQPIKKKVKNRPDEFIVEPRLRTWKHTESFLAKPVTMFEGRYANSLNKDDMGAVLDSIESNSSSNRTRQNLIALSKWARHTTNPETRKPYVASNWFNDFDKPLREELGLQKRIKDADAVGLLWRALRSDENCPGSLHSRRALALILCTALRAKEVTTLTRDSVIDINGDNPRLYIHPSLVKKCRYMVVPLNRLAVEIIKEAMASHNHDALFPGQDGSSMMKAATLSKVMRGTKKHVGICVYLGWDQHAVGPHGLRRTASSLLRAKGFGYSLSDIALILDHQSGDEEHTTTSGYAEDFTVDDDRGDDFHDKRVQLAASLEKAIRAAMSPKLVRAA